jgi:hypothetical protein
MASEGPEIDLYAEDIEFNQVRSNGSICRYLCRVVLTVHCLTRLQQDSEFNDQNVDLYDDVITQSGKGGTGIGGSNGSLNSGRDGAGAGGSGNAASSNSSTHPDDELSSQNDSSLTHTSHADHHSHHQNHSASDRDSLGNGKKISLYVGNLTWVCKVNAKPRANVLSCYSHFSCLSPTIV